MVQITWLVVLFQLAGCALLQPEPEPPKPIQVYMKDILSDVYLIDGKYKSMRGPAGIQHFQLSDGDPELLWIVGYETIVVGNEAGEAMSQEFMCHANLDFDAVDYYNMFPTSVPLSGRVFTLSQGQQTIRFPDGFGIPVGSHLPFQLATQVLNLNLEKPDLNVRHHVKVYYARDVELEKPMIPLFQGAVEGFKALEDARYYGVPEGEVDPALHGAGCGVGLAAVPGGASDDDTFGQQFTAHWVVPPGKEVNVTNVTRFLNLPFDTEAHYIAVHMHPFGESLTLRDLTLNQDVFSATADNAKERIGLERVDYYSSVEGLKLYRGHEYELISVYDNTLDEDIDSMAVMYLYLNDKQFKKPDFTLKL